MQAPGALREKQLNIARFWSDRQGLLPGQDQDLYYTRYPKRFVERYQGTHPAVMADRIARHPIALDHDSPRWRTQLTASEKRTLLMGWVVDHTTDRFTARGDYTLVGRHS